MADLESVLKRLEAVTARLENVADGKSAGAAAAGGDSDELSPSVVAWDSQIVSGPLALFLSKSEAIGGDVQTQAGKVKLAFLALRNYLVMASKSKKPSDSDVPQLLKPLAEQIGAIQEFREQNRRSAQFNHLSGVSEGIPALGWVSVSPTPGPHVKDMGESAEFYTNKVLKEFRDSNPLHVEWVKAFKSLLVQMQEYIKEFHRTGVTWNPKGGDAKSFTVGAGGSAPPPPAAGGPSPPPPPGPPPPPAPVAAPDESTVNTAALLADLNKGLDVTKGLKKVTDDMKTHKNPALRKGPAPFKAAPASSPSKPMPAAKVHAPVKAPVTELQGKKWAVEFHKNNQNIVIDKVETKQVLYVYKCDNCVVQVKGKINSICVDSCKKTGIVFEDLVSTCEFVNCQSVKAQVNGMVPTVSIDKTDGCQVYLNEKSLHCQVLSAKSSEMNILVMKEDGDLDETPLPEQYKTVWNGKTFVTTVTEIA